MRYAVGLFLVLLHVGCGGDASETSAASSDAVVEEVTDDGDGDLADDEFGPDPEPMASDAEIDVLADRPDDAQDAEAERELDEEAARPQAEMAATVRCRKRIRVTFAVYTYLTADLATNGCWIPERTVQDPSFRDCHSDGSIERPGGAHWFYDDTNPRNALGTERARIRRCASGAKRGYEYMAFRDGRWRLVTERNAGAYFAELYLDDAHIDSLYYVRGVYRGNATLRGHRRVAPMLNFGPYPDTYSQRQIGHEILKVCKTVRNHGYLGLYEWHYPLPHDSPRVKTMVDALNACTRRR